MSDAYLISLKTDYRSYNPQHPFWRTLGQIRIEAEEPTEAVLKVLREHPESRVVAIRREIGVGVKELVTNPCGLSRGIHGDAGTRNEIVKLSDVLRLTESRQGVLKEPNANDFPWLLPTEGNHSMDFPTPSNLTENGVLEGDATKEGQTGIHNGTLSGEMGEVKNFDNLPPMKPIQFTVNPASNTLELFPQPGTDRVTVTPDGARTLVHILSIWMEGGAAAIEAARPQSISLSLDQIGTGTTPIASPECQPDQARDSGSESPKLETTHPCAPRTNDGLPPSQVRESEPDLPTPQTDSSHP